MAEALHSAVSDARARTLDFLQDLSPAQWLGPQLPIVNPLQWEAGHVGWFAEKWLLRGELGRQELLAGCDALYDSSAVAHGTRWSLPLPSPEATIDYLKRVRDAVLEALPTLEAPPHRYFVELSVFHEDMHDEAFLYSRLTHGWQAPPFVQKAKAPGEKGPLPGDVLVAGGEWSLGSERTSDFIFDNEKYAHRVPVQAFRMARAPVTQAEFLEFVRARGYDDSRLFSKDGWRWRQQSGARHPLHWRERDGGWERRDFDRFVPLEPHRPVIHVNAYEAEAYCRWAGRRLPTEAEWEVAAVGQPDGRGGLSSAKRRFPWGEASPSEATANLDARFFGCLDVSDLPQSDSAFGCRQMLGNVWEWTSSTFQPYPGFSADPYKDYSEPWFFDHRVLRGGAWMTRSRLIRPAYRNFYKPERRDVFAGFRTCAL